MNIKTINRFIVQLLSIPEIDLLILDTIKVKITEPINSNLYSPLLVIKLLPYHIFCYYKFNIYIYNLICIINKINKQAPTLVYQSLLVRINPKT